MPNPDTPLEVFRNLYKSHFGGLDYNSIRPSDAAAVKTAMANMDAAIDRLPAGTALPVRRAWQAKAAEISLVLQHGAYTRVNAMAAFILAGAALAEDVKLGPWVSQSLRDAQAAAKVKKSLHPLLGRLQASYSRLNLKEDQKRHLTGLLSSPAGPRVSQPLQALDVVALQAAYTKFIERARPAAMPAAAAGAVAMGSLTAPSKVQLKPRLLRCVSPAESGGDEVYLVSSFVWAKNTQALIDQIQTALQGNQQLIKLQVDWGLSSWTSPLYQDTQADASIDLGSPLIGEQGLNRGFGPWAFYGALYETDQPEYAAVAAALTTVSDYAATVAGIAQGAGDVLAECPPAAAAAEVVAAAAAIVSVAADVVAAIVNLIASFQTDRFIGSASLVAPDYCMVPLGDTPRNLGMGSNRGGQYSLTLVESRLAPLVSFDRAWRYEALRRYGPEFGSDRWDTDGSHDRHVEIDFGGTINSVANYGIDISSHSGGHAEWVAAPVIEADFRHAVGTVHWGVRWVDFIHFKPWVECWRFTTLI